MKRVYYFASILILVFQSFIYCLGVNVRFLSAAWKCDRGWEMQLFLYSQVIFNTGFGPTVFTLCCIIQFANMPLWGPVRHTGSHLFASLIGYNKGVVFSACQSVCIYPSIYLSTHTHTHSHIHILPQSPILNLFALRVPPPIWIVFISMGQLE